MISRSHFKEAARLFFEDRAAKVHGKPSLDDLCYISGKDPRLWTNETRYTDLIESITTQLDLSQNVSLLEIGCAAGYLAYGLASNVGNYVGIDIALEPVKVAKRLGLNNSTFQKDDATNLSFANQTYDRVLCYDVFNNFPSFEYGISVIQEMWRVLRPGGKLMVGCIPEKFEGEDLQVKIHHKIQAKLEKEYGPVEPMLRKSHWNANLKRLYFQKLKKIEPQVTCYTFERKSFQELEAKLAANCTILDIHQMNPYHGYRFNVIYEKNL